MISERLINRSQRENQIKVLTIQNSVLFMDRDGPRTVRFFPSSACPHTPSQRTTPRSQSFNHRRQIQPNGMWLITGRKLNLGMTFSQQLVHFKTLVNQGRGRGKNDFFSEVTIKTDSVSRLSILVAGGEMGSSSNEPLTAFHITSSPSGWIDAGVLLFSFLLVSLRTK